MFPRRNCTTDRRGFAAIVALLVLPIAFATAARAAVTIAWIPVANPGNAADTADGNFGLPGIQNFGAVPYAYSIDKYDVTNSQYVEFLNAKDPTGANTLGLYNSSMSDATYGGISFNSGNADGSKFSVLAGDGQHPVTFVTWYDTLRFANWLNNGQGNGDTEGGAYTLQGGAPTPTNGNFVFRNPGATVFLPSEDEWYKAAYYNPATSSYYQFPTSSNTTPAATGPTATPNSANYQFGVGHPSDVGAYTGTTSPYGALDMGGNVFQWDELYLGGLRALRGSCWAFSETNMLSSGQAGDDPQSTGINLVDLGFVVGFGFRVAMIPEPSTFVLAAVGGLALLVFRWRP